MYGKLKAWLTSYDKFVFNERIDRNYRFSFWVWGKKVTFPFLLAYLKEQIDGKDCLMIGFSMAFDKISHPVVDAVIKDRIRTEKFVQKLIETIDSNKYDLEFYPNPRNIKSIRLRLFIDIDSLEKKSYTMLLYVYGYNISKSVRATIPNDVVEHLDLEVGDVVEWETFKESGKHYAKIRKLQ